MRKILRPNNCGAIQNGRRIGSRLSIHPSIQKLLLANRSSWRQTFDGTRGGDGDDHAPNLVYIWYMHLQSFYRKSFLKVWAGRNLCLLPCSTIYPHLQILLSSIVILSFTMDSKDGTTAHVDKSVPDYDLGLSSADDAAALGMFIITCQCPRLTFNHSETRLQAGVASKFFQARSFCDFVQYYRTFAFNCLHSRLFHSCWASWHGLGQSRRPWILRNALKILDWSQ